MSAEGTPEQQAIEARLADTGACPALGGRVFYDFVPEETPLERDALGLTLPYAVVDYGELFATGEDRSIEGPEQQPLVQSFVVEIWGARAAAVREAAGQVRVALLGFTPVEGNSSPIELGGGSRRFSRRDTFGKPVSFMVPITGTTTINNSITVP